MSTSLDGYVSIVVGPPIRWTSPPRLRSRICASRRSGSLTPAISADAGLTFERSRELPGGSIELVYSCRGSRSDLPERPESQRATDAP